MNTTTNYLLSTLRYVHSSATGEMINIGVLLYSAEAEFLGLQIDQHYSHLSKTFKDFDGDFFRKATTNLISTVEQIKQELAHDKVALLKIDAPQNIFGHFEKDMLVKKMAYIQSRIIPDSGLSLQFAKATLGMTNNPEKALETAFCYYVKEQRPATVHHESRSDDEVWSVFKNYLEKKSIISHLKPKPITTDSIDHTFEYAYKNGSWHLLQPMTLDYINAEDIRKKAGTWAGISLGLKDYQDPICLYLLLGKPQNAKHLEAYNKAKNLLSKSPQKIVLVEESEAKEFAESFERKYIHNH